tara:strand:- start:2656 stop:3204 length:549 start_codon:yes stop_codon:yes gene_type:complete
MIEARRLRQEVSIPEGVDVQVDDRMVIVKKGNYEVRRNLYFPTVLLERTDGTVKIEPKKFTKREKKIINTFKAHLLNMINGVQEPYVYKVKVCSSHFPMSVAVSGKEVVVKNFLGEKIPRKANIVEGADVKVEGDMIVVTSADIEAAGQTAANCEQSTRITNRDRRIFQDGLWIVQKANKEL